MIGYGEAADLKFRRVEKGKEKGRVVRGFQVFRIFGGVGAPVGELWIGEVAYFNVSEEELRRRVEEAMRTAPDLLGIKKIWHVLPWLNTDVSFAGKWIVATTAHLWQAAWYIGLFGEPKSTSGGANVTEEGIKPNVTMLWPREVLDRIIAEEGEELKPLLGRTVNSWRELVDAIDWSWVLKKVEEMVEKLKPWIGPERANNVEREGLARRMLGELELLVHFAEARRGKDDGRWREERAKKLARAVEALSGGRIAGEYAERLAQAIIRYAEGRKKQAKERIDKLAGELAGVSREEVWSIVKFVLSDMYCLVRDCARDVVVRKFVEPALELMMLDKALNNEFDKEGALLRFGEMYATAVAGDGTVESKRVELTVGGELGGGAALLRLATLHLLNQLLPDELKFNARIYVKKDRYYDIATYGEDAARFMHLLAVSAPSAGGEYLSDKFNEFVEEARVKVQLDKNSIKRTKKGRVAADLTLSEANIAIKYNVYLRDKAIELEFQSTDRSRVELAARLLRHAGVGAEVKKREGRDVWYVKAATDMLAAGREELRDALAEIVRAAVKKGWVDAGKAEGWLKKLEEGRVLKEGWPKYLVRLSSSGALEVKYQFTNPNNIQREAQRLREMGLEEGVHFSVKMPEGGNKAGYVYIRREGLVHAAWLSKNGSEDQRELAADFVNYILQKAEKAGKEVYDKAREVIDERELRGSLMLKGFEKEVEVDGKKHKVKVIDGGAEFDEGKGGKKLLRIKITAEVGRVEGEHTIVDRVVREYIITFGRYGADNVVRGFAVAKADSPDDGEADAERLSALVEVLTGVKPRIYRMKNGAIIIVCSREHLEGFARYAELADAIKKWLLNI